MQLRSAQFISIVLAILISGCSGIPVGLKIAALAGSGVSLAATGKTLPDHALSSVTAQDCRLMRLVGGHKICIDAALDAQAVASQETAPFATQRPGRYAVIGSFANVVNARNWGARFPEFTPRVIRVEQVEGTLYRVAVGPIANEASAMLSDQFHLAGIEDPWTMTVCAPAPATILDNCETQLASL